MTPTDCSASPWCWGRISLEHFHDWWNRRVFQWRLVCDSLLSMIRWGIVMGKAYSQGLRERVMAAVDAGTGAYVAASFFRVSVSYIYKALGRRERTGQTSARPWAPPNRSLPHMTAP